MLDGLGGGTPLKADAEGKLLLDELKASGVVKGDVIAEKLLEDPEMAEFSKEEMQDILALAFISVSNGILRYLNRKSLTLEQADRWAKCTEIVYRKYLRQMKSGQLVHAALTVGIFMGAEKLPPKPGEGGNGTKA